MKLLTKAKISSLILAALLILVLLSVSLYAFRQFSIHTAKEHAESVAEVVRVSLTEMMINGVIQHRAGFLERMKQVDGVVDIHLVRGPKVTAQYDRGLDQEMSHDIVEQQVLTNGESVFQLVDEKGMSPIFRSTIPYIASATGTPNCLSCHQVQEGDVLGAVTITLSVGQLKQSALVTVATITLVVALFAIIVMIVLVRLLKPIVATTNDIQQLAEAAIDGKFNQHVEVRSNDEIGQIAVAFNQLTAHLQEGLLTIRNNVAQLIQCSSKQDNGDLLASTIRMVGGLIEASQFKQAIEEDETKFEVYQRLANIIEKEFQITTYSIYEVNSSKNRLIPILIDGESDNGGCNWCNPNILVRSEVCRARRTGHTIDAIEYPGICNAFCPPDDGKEYQHVCVPVMQSGAVGSIVQLVIEADTQPNITEITTLLYVYLREASPVIEAKRLMDTLRESTLLDPMTGLHNRRFLEEYSDTIIATTSRRKTNVSILMLDLDYFKKVNDTYGHDAGDKVLRAISKIFRATVRSSDLVIRYGGEEFIIILQDTENEGAIQVGEKIRAAVEAHTFALPGAELKKTISVGISCFPQDSETFWQAIKFADVALYRAKEEGRNRVVRFTPEMWNSDDY